MEVIFILLSIWLAIFLFVSYHAIVNGNKLAIWATGICLWMIAVFLLGIKMFC